MISPHGLWSETKVLLKAQMTNTTFDMWLAKTEAARLDGDLLTVRSPNPLALDWLNNKLAGTCSRTLSRIAGVPLRVVFVNGAASAEVPTIEPDPQPPAPNPLLTDYNPRKRLWAKHPLASRFYPAYFVRVAGRIVGSTCFPLWRLLCDKFDMSKSDHLDWTPPATYVAAHLAATLGCPVTYLIGRLRTCHRFDQALLETGEVIDCCTHFRGAQIGQTQQGRPACHYRVAGALEVLTGEGWLAARRLGTDSRDTRFEIQALRFPPFLTPAQLALLGPELSELHRQFLHESGLDFDSWDRGEYSQVGEVGLTLDRNAVLLPIGNKSFFLAHNWCQGASKLGGPPPSDHEGQPGGG